MELRTDIHAVLAERMPAFANDVLVPFSEYDLRPQTLERRPMQNQIVDLSRVIGTMHPDYSGYTWLELLGGGNATSTPQLKRIDKAMSNAQSNPDYYSSALTKDEWYFYLVDGRYYIGENGNHRTVLARFLLACNGMPTTVSGVHVTELILLKAESEPLAEPTSLGWGARLRNFFAQQAG